MPPKKSTSNARGWGLRESSLIDKGEGQLFSLGLERFDVALDTAKSGVTSFFEPVARALSNETPAAQGLLACPLAKERYMLGLPLARRTTAPWLVNKVWTAIRWLRTDTPG